MSGKEGEIEKYNRKLRVGILLFRPNHVEDVWEIVEEVPITQLFFGDKCLSLRPVHSSSLGWKKDEPSRLFSIRASDLAGTGFILPEDVLEKCFLLDHQSLEGGEEKDRLCEHLAWDTGKCNCFEKSGLSVCPLYEWEYGE